MSNLAIDIDHVSKEFVIDGLGDYQRATEVFAKWLRSKLLNTRVVKDSSSQADTDSGHQFGRRRFLALDQINLQVQHGETLGIVGSNGAGKSTLLKILSRIVTPTTGRVGVAGRIGCLLEVGTGFHPELTGRENVYLNGAILGMPRREIRKRFDEIVQFAEVETFLDMPVKRYSNGMLIRLGFSVAAHLDPDVLIVDEVLGVGDAAFQKKSLGKAREFREQGRTVLMVSHNLPMIAGFCTRAILLEAGKLVADGTPPGIIERHLHHDKMQADGVVWTSHRRLVQTDYLRVSRIEVKDNLQRDALSLEAPIDINITFEVTQPGHRVCFQLALSDESGCQVFRSINIPAMNSDHDPYYDQEMPIGNYCCRCQIPAKFLNAKRYLISLSIGQEPNRVDAVADSLLGFEIVDTAGHLAGVNVAWANYVTRPQLKWQTWQIKAHSSSI